MNPPITPLFLCSKKFQKKAKVSHQGAFAPSVCHSHNLTAISRKYIGSIYDLIQTTKQFNQNTDCIALLSENRPGREIFCRVWSVNRQRTEPHPAYLLRCGSFFRSYASRCLVWC